jgi:uncharacterized membrane protein YdjX (TVP38/TMEM64 family)
VKQLWVTIWARMRRRRDLSTYLLWLAGAAALAGLVVAAVYVLGPYYGRFVSVTSSVEGFRAWIGGLGVWAPVIFFLVQIAQVIVALVPGNLTTIAGGTLFGPVGGSILNAAAMLTGSLLAFALARLLGRRFVIRMVGAQRYARYSSRFTGRFSLGLFLLFLLPFSPGDALCFLAGLSPLPLRIYLALLLLGRLPGTIVGTLVGAGVLAFTAWQWAVLGAVCLAILVVFFRWGRSLEVRLADRALGRRPAPPAPEQSGD